MALAVGCTSRPLPPDARSVPSSGEWVSPSGQNRIRLTRVRWSVDGGRLQLEPEFGGEHPAAEDVPIAWVVDDVLGELGSGRGLARVGGAKPFSVRVALPQPPPRIIGLRLQVGDPSARWAAVRKPAASPEAVVITIPGGQARVPHVTVTHTSSAPRIDGRLDEPAWSVAPILTFADSLGRPGTVTENRGTRLRLLYDDEALFVGFEVEDPDVTERFERRDDPIYEHEAVELFLMPHRAGPATGPYVELQASPGGVVFDASFLGPREGMDRRWNGDQKVVSRVDGTLDDPRPDRGWTSEWRIPFTSLRWVRKVPAAGEVWRMNAFRIDRSRGHPDLYVAWSPPRMGDFHRVEKFGFVTFGPASTSAETSREGR